MEADKAPMVHVRIISPVVLGTRRDPAALRILERPGLCVSRTKIERGPATVESEFEDGLAIPHTVALAVKAEREGCDAIVIDCMADPGLDASREMVAIPVLGPCEYGMHLAACLGHRFSVVTALGRGRVMFEARAERYGCITQLASVRAIEKSVMDLDSDRDDMALTLAAVALTAVREDNADVILFGCTGMFGTAERVRDFLLENGHDVPVIDPVPTTVRMAAALVESGLTHSKIAYPPPEREKPLPGFEWVRNPAVVEGAGGI